MADSPKSDGLTESSSLDAWLASQRERLRRMVVLRLDQRIAGRIDASDVVQETLFEAARRHDEFRAKASVPDYVWLRCLALQQLALAQRKHLAVRARDARRDRSIAVANASAGASVSSVGLAHLLLERTASPSQAACREEVRRRVREALDELDPLDREVLALRHFEQLTNAEVAQVLQLSISAASKRYVRAIGRIRSLLTSLQD
jgi:RNA polymerase sigma-70 factor (ECF subfamily)